MFILVNIHVQSKLRDNSLWQAELVSTTCPSKRYPKPDAKSTG